eukprot:TRINITY_DN8144_c0_g1_i1.p1 TRINITY_DN8144_c0_g1~~TRINITY_DN8144_c0_g1_i1.p1  ORF type:complete len:751 (+),score=173.24 TRINITY_DN8144_c0_g1_i1:196-2448(+)
MRSFWTKQSASAGKVETPRERTEDGPEGHPARNKLTNMLQSWRRAVWKSDEASLTDETNAFDEQGQRKEERNLASSSAAAANDAMAKTLQLADTKQRHDGELALASEPSGNEHVDEGSTEEEADSAQAEAAETAEGEEEASSAAEDAKHGSDDRRSAMGDSVESDAITRRRTQHKPVPAKNNKSLRSGSSSRQPGEKHRKKRTRRNSKHRKRRKKYSSSEHRSKSCRRWCHEHGSHRRRRGYSFERHPRHETSTGGAKAQRHRPRSRSRSRSGKPLLKRSQQEFQPSDAGATVLLLLRRQDARIEALEREMAKVQNDTRATAVLLKTRGARNEAFEREMRATALSLQTQDARIAALEQRVTHNKLCARVCALEHEKSQAQMLHTQFNTQTKQLQVDVRALQQWSSLPTVDRNLHRKMDALHGELNALKGSTETWKAGLHEHVLGLQGEMRSLHGFVTALQQGMARIQLDMNPARRGTALLQKKPKAAPSHQSSALSTTKGDIPLCKLFVQMGFCRFSDTGEGCKFLHASAELLQEAHENRLVGEELWQACERMYALQHQNQLENMCAQAHAPIPPPPPPPPSHVSDFGNASDFFPPCASTEEARGTRGQLLASSAMAGDIKDEPGDDHRELHDGLDACKDEWEPDSFTNAVVDVDLNLLPAGAAPSGIDDKQSETTMKEEEEGEEEKDEEVEMGEEEVKEDKEVEKEQDDVEGEKDEEGKDKEEQGEEDDDDDDDGDDDEDDEEDEKQND